MRSFARAFLRLVVALAAGLAATVLLVANPITRPTVVGEAAIETGAPSGVLELGTDLIIRQASDAGEDEVRALTTDQEERLRWLIKDAFTLEWATSSIRDVAEGMEAWISGTNQPDVSIDLTAPKERIRTHPDALLLVSAAGVDGVEDIEPDAINPGPGTTAAVDMFLADLPDQVSLVETTWWSDFTSRASDLRDGTMRIGLISSLIALVAVAIGVAVTPRPRLPSISSWLSWLMLWTAIPLLVIAGAITTAASGIPLPDEISLANDVVGQTWEPARLIGWIALGGALALWASTHILRERETAEPVIHDKVDVEDRTPVSVG